MASELYATAGVDPRKIHPFKRKMIEVGKQTATFPNKHQVFVDTRLMHAHGGVYEYRGSNSVSWCATLEGLGNANWIAEYQRLMHPEGPTYHDAAAYNAVMMASNDCAAQGAQPVILLDKISASDSDWFTDEERNNDIARGFFEACADTGMALVAGESPAYKYLACPRPPVKSAAIFSCVVKGIIDPSSRKITGEKLRPGDVIIGVPSSGIHCNGHSLLIQCVLGGGVWPGLPDTFDTKLPSGMTIGEASQIRTVSYARLVNKILQHRSGAYYVHAILPGTGDGVAKLAFDDRAFTHRIHTWTKVPELLWYLYDVVGIPLDECLKTFNWGVGYYFFVDPAGVEYVLAEAHTMGFDAFVAGVVEEGERCTIFGPAGDLKLPPPGH